MGVEYWDGSGEGGSAPLLIFWPHKSRFASRVSSHAITTLPLPTLTIAGAAVHSRRTRAVTEAMVASLAVTTAALGLGIVTASTGLHAAMVAIVLGNAAMVWVLWARTRETVRALV